MTIWFNGVRNMPMVLQNKSLPSQVYKERKDHTAKISRHSGLDPESPANINHTHSTFQLKPGILYFYLSTVYFLILLEKYTIYACVVFLTHNAFKA